MARKAYNVSAETRARRLASELGATISVGLDEVTAELASGRWDFTDTQELISSRESGEEMDDVWVDLLMQMEFGVQCG